MQTDVYVTKIGFESSKSVFIRYALKLNGHLIASFSRQLDAQLAASRLYEALTNCFVEPIKFCVYE